MKFVQIIDYRTDRPDEVDEVLSDWIAASQGSRTARLTRVCRDRHDPTHYMELLEFDSAADATVNSNLPETQAVHQRFAPLCTDGPHFIDLDVVRDEAL